jgi:hypothetical protein
MFNDLVMRNLAEVSASGGITGFNAWNLKSSGFRQISNDDASHTTQVQIDTHEVSKVLSKMEELYGKEHLESISADQLYNEYKNFLALKIK